MAAALQHKAPAQCPRLSAPGARNHRPVARKTDHELRFKLDQSVGADHAAWLGIVIYGDHWQNLEEHYGIAIAMAFGSYFAGSTPMGGGTVGFPILVLLFSEPATLGRDFSFAVQSIGMTSASILILCRRQPLEWVMLRWSLLGTLIGTPLRALFIAPFVPEPTIKIFFAII